MKKLATASVIAALFCSPLYVNAADTAATDSIRFTAGGKTAVHGDAVIRLPAASYVDDGNVMVPLRVLAAGLHAEVHYDTMTKAVTMTKGDRSIRVRLSDNRAVANAQTIRLPARPTLHVNTIFGPVRSIAIALNAEIAWNRTLKSVTIFAQRGTAADRQVKVDYTFNQGAEGWKGGFADLPFNYEPDIYELDHRVTAVPNQNTPINGLLLKGHNRSDDLFMYVVKKLDKESGLKPKTKYTVQLKFQLATDQGGGGIGIGGAPAEAVYVKAGVLGFEPKADKVQEADTEYYRMNLDKGNQATGGQHMTPLGNIVKPDSETADYQLKPFEHMFTVQTNDKGEAYLILGIDSGFEGLTTIYFTNVSATFKAAGK